MSIAGVTAVAFDLDDTLTDWWTGIERASAAVAAPEILDRVRTEVWCRRDGIVVDRHHWRMRREAATFMPAELVEPFRAALDPPLFEDATPTLHTLHGRVRLAVLTNNPRGDEVIARLGLHPLFECVVVADRETLKPDPSAFATLVDQLGLAPGAIAYVGDSVTDDVEGAVGAGMRAVWLNRWNDPWPLPPGVLCIGSLTELCEQC